MYTFVDPAMHCLKDPQINSGNSLTNSFLSPEVVGALALKVLEGSSIGISIVVVFLINVAMGRRPVTSANTPRTSIFISCELLNVAIEFGSL